MMTIFAMLQKQTDQQTEIGSLKYRLCSKSKKNSAMMFDEEFSSHR